MVRNTGFKGVTLILHSLTSIKLKIINKRNYYCVGTFIYSLFLKGYILRIKILLGFIYTVIIIGDVHIFKIVLSPLKLKKNH
jgi:hypothetical protein